MTLPPPQKSADMGAQGTLVEPVVMTASPAAERQAGLISVIVPVVERADDLLAVYRAFAGELESRSADFEFLFVFDGRFAPSPEIIALIRANENVRVLRFAREFGETAALRLGIE